MQALVRDLQKQSISGPEPFENQENFHDSGTESDEEELLILSDRELVTKHRRKTSFSMVDPPTICSSPLPNDTDSKDSFGKESGILTDGEDHSDYESKTISEKDCTFPVMTMENPNAMPMPSTSPLSPLRPRRCRVRVLVNRRQRQESESDMEIVLKSPTVSRRAHKRPALDLDKMMKTRLDAVPPKRERLSSCSSTFSND